MVAVTAKMVVAATAEKVVTVVMERVVAATAERVVTVVMAAAAATQVVAIGACKVQAMISVGAEIAIGTKVVTYWDQEHSLVPW